MFYNYKSRNSIVLLALCDANYNFIYIDIGYNWRASDGGVLTNSTLNAVINDPQIVDIPAPRPLPGRIMPLPFFIVADDAFPLKDNVMKPYPRRGLSEKQRIFNYRQSISRLVIENTFSILVSKFRVLSKSINLVPEKAEIIVKACCILHNIIKTKSVNDNTYSDEKQSTHNLVSLTTSNNRNAKSARQIRDEIAD